MKDFFCGAADESPGGVEAWEMAGPLTTVSTLTTGIDRWVVTPCNTPVFIKVGRAYLDHEGLVIRLKYGYTLFYQVNFQ